MVKPQQKKIMTEVTEPRQFEPFLTKVDLKSIVIYPKIEDGIMNVYLKAEIINKDDWAETDYPDDSFTGFFSRDFIFFNYTIL